MVPAGPAGKQHRAEGADQVGSDGSALPLEVYDCALPRQGLAMTAASRAQRAQHERTAHRERGLEGQCEARQQHAVELGTDASPQQGRRRHKVSLTNTGAAGQEAGPHADPAVSAPPQRSKRARQTSIRLSDICNGAAEREAARLAVLEVTAARQEAEPRAHSMRGRSLPEAQAAVPAANKARKQALQRVDRQHMTTPADSLAPPAKKQKPAPSMRGRLRPEAQAAAPASTGVSKRALQLADRQAVASRADCPAPPAREHKPAPSMRSRSLPEVPAAAPAADEACRQALQAADRQDGAAPDDSPAPPAKKQKPAPSMRGRSLPEAQAAAPASNGVSKQAVQPADRQDVAAPADSPATPAKKRKTAEPQAPAAARSAPSPASAPAGFVLKVPLITFALLPLLPDQEAGCYSE